MSASAEGGTETTLLDEPTTPLIPPSRIRWHLLGTQRALQVVLGLFWLLDAGLQFQPFMFGQGFTTTYLLHNAQGQPAVIAWIITNVGHWVAPHVAVWNTFFALIQVAIGLGLLFRRTVRPALLVSFFWAFGVWFFGEGLGQILSGSASALTGAPGSVFVYGLIGLMAWPHGSGSISTESEPGKESVGIASSAAAQGIGGAATPMAVWSGFWALAAILFLLPNNRTQTSVSSAITGMSPGEPGGYSHFLTHLGNHFGSVGVQTAWLLAIASLIIGIGPLVARRPEIFLASGALLSTLFWISGQGLGGIFTGSGTDPNTGPLIVLLALAMMPATVAEHSTWRSPLAHLLARVPIPTLGALALLGLALFLGAAYPVAAHESTGTAMAGMPGMRGPNSSGSGGTAATASCTSGNNFAPRTGLDVTNTPNMVMSGHLGMNMNGSDANAAAGLNTTKSNWHYTGPALSQSLAQELLAQGGNGIGDIHMAVSGCATEPTFSQEINAEQYVQATSAAVARYANPFQAIAAGFVAVSPADYPVTYYVNPSILAANVTAQRALDPGHVDGLVFAKIPSGAEVLVAAMYVLPSSMKTVPMPFGPLVQWHERTNVCGPLTRQANMPFDITGTVPCVAGSVPRPTPYVTMVWQIPVAGGPLAIQPQDIQIVEAAVMAEAAS